jgi:hypothetical protein
MNSYVLSAVLLIVVITLVPSPTSGLKCWDCNSKTEPKCNDPFEAESMETLKQECGMLQNTCMKTSAKAKGVSVVTRTCSTKVPGMDDGCKSIGSGGDEGEAANCYCSTELCNGSQGLKTSYVGVLAAFGILGKILMENFHAL